MFSTMKYCQKYQTILWSQKSEIVSRTQLKVYVYSHGNKVGLAELNNRCVRERVSTKFATLDYDSNSLLMSWLVIFCTEDPSTL